MTEFGGPEVLKLAELPDPVPGPGEVLIRVTRAGLNFADTHTRTNSYVQRASLPLVPGGEVAGVREDTGERVVALVGNGGYAEYAVAPEERVFGVPDGLDDGSALAMVDPGDDRLAPVPHGRPGGPRGERRGPQRRRGRGLAGGPARPRLRGRQRDRHRLGRAAARAGARAGGRRGRRSGPRGPHGEAAGGQRRRARGRRLRDVRR